MDEDSIQLSDLHGTHLTISDGEGGRKALAGFTCSEYPECDVCGHIEEELASSEDDIQNERESL